MQNCVNTGIIFSIKRRFVNILVHGERADLQLKAFNRIGNVICKINDVGRSRTGSLNETRM